MKNRILLLILMFCFGILNIGYTQTNGINNKIFDLIPKGTNFIIKINVSKIFSIPEIYKTITDIFEKQREPKSFYDVLKNRAGIDLLKDINSIIYFPKIDFVNKFVGTTILIEGKFDLEKLVKALKEDISQAKDSNDAVISLVDGYYCGQFKDMYYILIDNQYIAFGDYFNLINDMKSLKNKSIESLNNDKNFIKVLNEIDSNSSIYGIGNGLKRSFIIKENTVDFSTINNFSFYLKYNKNLNFDLNVLADGEKNASSVFTKISNSTSLDPTIGKFVNSLNRDGEKISLSLTIPEKVINEIKTNFTQNGNINKPGTVLKDLRKENKTYRIGEFIRVGYWSYQVYSSEWLDDRKVKGFNMFNKEYKLLIGQKALVICLR